MGCCKITLIIQNLFHFKAMKKSLQESEIDIMEYSKKIFSLSIPSLVRWQWWIFWYFGLALPPLFHPTFKVWFDLLLCSWFLGTRGTTWLKYYFSCVWFRGQLKQNKPSPIRSAIFVIWIVLIFQYSKFKGESLGWKQNYSKIFFILNKMVLNKSWAYSKNISMNQSLQTYFGHILMKKTISTQWSVDFGFCNCKRFQPDWEKPLFIS